MKHLLRSLLNPVGRHSPLNPRNAFNLLRPVVERKPPKGALDDSHHSLLAELYGDATTLDKAPFPNMEWWWNAADCKAKDAGGAEQDFSIITNVHLFAIPLVGLVAQGTLAIRHRQSGRTFQIHSRGEVDPGPACHFEAKDWYAKRENSVYEFSAKGEAAKAALKFHQGKVAYFGDAEHPSGWYDNNPKGLIPYWASYRSRFGKVEGWFEIELTPGTISKWTIEDAKSHARFDHQSLHWSPRDVGTFTLPVLAEALITRPQWSWFHLTFPDPTDTTRKLNFMAYELRNGHSGNVLKRAAALNDDDGDVALIGDELVLQTLGHRRDKAFRVTGMEFTVPESDDGLRKWHGTYSLNVERDAVKDFTVDYPVYKDFRYRAKELCVNVKGLRRSKAKRDAFEGQGVEEVFDMFSSFGVKD